MPQGSNRKIRINESAYIEMQCYAAIGRFVKEFEFLISVIRNFLKPCLQQFGWPNEKINSQLAWLPAGELIKLLKKYNLAFPKDVRGQVALEDFRSVLTKINLGRIQLLHGFHMGDFERRSFTTTKSYQREKGKIETITLRHTPEQLDRWEKAMGMLSGELWRAMRNIKQGKSIHKSLVAANRSDFQLPELGATDF